MHAWRDPSLSGKYDAEAESRKLTDGPAPTFQKVKEDQGEDVRTDGVSRKVVLAKAPSPLNSPPRGSTTVTLCRRPASALRAPARLGPQRADPSS